MRVSCAVAWQLICMHTPLAACIQVIVYQTTGPHIVMHAYTSFLLTEPIEVQHNCDLESGLCGWKMYNRNDSRQVGVVRPSDVSAPRLGPRRDANPGTESGKLARSACIYSASKYQTVNIYMVGCMLVRSFTARCTLCPKQQVPWDMHGL